MIVVWLFLTICKTISDFPLSKKKGLTLFIKVSRYLKVELKVSKGAEIRNQYNQVLHLTQDTKGKVTNSQLDTTNESKEVSPFPAGDTRHV